MESAEIKFNLASEKFKGKLVELKQSIRSFKENKNLDKLKVDSDLLKEDFADWLNDELVYWSSMDSIQRKNCFTRKTFQIENDYLNLMDEANKLILEEDFRYVFTEDPECGILLSCEYVKSVIKTSIYLPRIRSPRFNGDKDDWKTFAKVFKFLYDTSFTNDEQRLLYLKALLGKGKAPSIEHYTNFEDAWQYLEQHFADLPM